MQDLPCSQAAATKVRPLPVAGIVLASGLSRRFDGANKLLAPVDGVPIVRRTVQAYVDADLDPVVVVMGYQAEEIREALGGLAFMPLFNPDFALGQSRALVSGVRAVVQTAGAAVIGVADQPFLAPSVIRTLVDAYCRDHPSLVVPRFAGRRGNPVLFDRRHFPELLEIEGDVGGRPVLDRHRDEILWIDVPDERMGMDLDTPEELAALAHRPEAGDSVGRRAAP